MRSYTKIFLCTALVLICLITFATLAFAEEFTVSNDNEFKAALEDATDGDTVIITNSLNGTLDFGKSITYVLDGNGIVWTAGAQNTATGKSVSVISKNGNNTFKPNSSMWCNSYGLTVKDLSSTSWTLSAEEDASLLFDLSIIVNNGRLFYGTFLKEINLKSGVNVTKLYSTNGSGDTNFIKCGTLNIYEGAKIYGNYFSRPIIDVTTLNMYGGEICGNVCVGMWAGISASYLNMYGGSINSNYQPSPHGTYTNANDPQSVAFVAAGKSALIYESEITSNYVGLGHDGANNGTVSGISSREGNPVLYVKDGSIDKNVLVVHGTVVKSVSAAENVTIPSGYVWAAGMNNCKSIDVSTDKQGTYYVVIPHSAKNDDGNCETALLCNKCQVTILEAKAHDAYESLVYESYLGKGVYIFECKNEGCIALDVTEERNALIISLGLSVYENAGYASVVQGFKFDNDAIDEYERVNNICLSYGVVVASQTRLEGENPLVVENGTVNPIGDFVILTGMSNIGCTAFEIKIKGLRLNDDDILNAKLVFCAYVCNGEEIVYIDNGGELEIAPSRSYVESKEA